MSKIVNIYHYNSKITDLISIMEYEGIPVYSNESKNGIKPEEFLNFKNDRDKSNRDILFDSFADKYKNLGISSSSAIKADSKIFSPVIFALPSEYATQSILTTESTLQVANDDYNAFLSLEILKVINSPEYKDEFITKSNPRVSVFVWCRALNQTKESEKNSIINITPFIQDLNTSNAKNGGNFSITLTPVLASMSTGSNGEPLFWGFEGSSFKTFIDNDSLSIVNKVNINLQKETNVSFQSNDNTDSNSSNSEIIRTKLLLTNILSENDLVFIKFEELEAENSAKGDLSDYYIPASSLAKQNWDMIGLIDKNSTATSPGDITTLVSGRDLIKLLIEDGTYFFQNHFANPDSKTSIFKNKFVNASGDRSSALNNEIIAIDKINRLMGFDAEPIINGLFNPKARTIEYIMNLLIRCLSNIEICPTSLFKDFENKTEFQFEIDPKEKSNGDSTSSKVVIQQKEKE